MLRKTIKRLLVMAFILVFTCEMGLRLRLAYLYRNPAWLLYHQFRFRTAEEINVEDLPHYYKDNMFRPFRLVYREDDPSAVREIITVESSALRSIRRQLQRILQERPNLVWLDYAPNDNKEIEFSNNSIVLYEFLVYPDIYNTLKRESRVLKRFLGPTIDDFLYHNLAFYMHLDENINFTTMDSDRMLRDYLKLLRSREEPLCKSISKKGFKNVIYVLTPNKFDPNSKGGRVYLKYTRAAHKEMLDMLNEYNVPCIDLMDKKVEGGDFSDFFHFSPEGGRKMSLEILNYLNEEGYIDAV